MENRKLTKLLEDCRNEEHSEVRLSIVSNIKTLLTISPDLFCSSVPYSFPDITLMTCIVRTLKGYPAGKLNCDVKRELCCQLSAVCVLLLQPEPQIPGNFLVDVLAILRGMQIVTGPFKNRVPEKVKELYRVVHKCVNDGMYGGEVETQLWQCCRRTFENSLLQCIVSETNPETNNNNKISNSRWQRLILESRANMGLFQTATSIVVSVCRMARGNTTVVNFARTFFAGVHVHKKTNAEEVLSFFPERLHALLMSILLPWKQLPSEIIIIHLDHLCRSVLDGLENGLWTVGDISMLALACPDWYQVLLEAVAFGKSSDSTGHVLLSRMWGFDCRDDRRHLTMALKELDLS